LENSCIADFGPSVPCLYILTEFANGGNLAEYIRDHQPLSEEEIWLFFTDVLLGLEFLHRLEIIHRDVKTSNLLLHYNQVGNGGGRRPKIMLTDFGTSILLEKVKATQRTGHTGTIEFLVR